MYIIYFSIVGIIEMCYNTNNVRSTENKAEVKVTFSLILSDVGAANAASRSGTPIPPDGMGGD